MLNPHNPQCRSGSEQVLYGEDYYLHYCGAPYVRGEPWSTFFATIAERIVCDMRVRSALDVGCAKGFLVEALRDRGVEAFGFDISTYAIDQVREDVRPYCLVASILEYVPRRVDLVVCIEVLEHLHESEAEAAVGKLCQCADDILFSSTPTDETEPTHINVQPVEYWADLFARQGFYRDVEFDASFVSEHAMRFCKRPLSEGSLVKRYERRLWTLWKEVQAHRRLNLELTDKTERLSTQLGATSEEAVERDRQLREANQKIACLETQLGDAVLAIEQGKSQEKATAAMNRSLESRLAAAFQEQQALETRLCELSSAKERLDARVLTVSQEKAQALGKVLQVQETNVRLRQSERQKENWIGYLAPRAAQLDELQLSLDWELLCVYRRVRDRVFSEQGRSRYVYELVIRGLLLLGTHGPRALAQKVMSRLRRHGPTGPEPSACERPVIPISHAAQRVSWCRQALILSGAGQAMERYRCHHAQDQFQRHGIPCAVWPMTSSALTRHIPEFDLVILHRVPHSQAAELVIKAARAHQAVVLFDIDDLVFNVDVLPRFDALKTMSQGERDLYESGVRRYRQTLDLCDGAIVPTEALADAVAGIGKPVWIHRNALGEDLLKYSEEAYRIRSQDQSKVVIGYASGSRTHNRDFQEVGAAVRRIFAQYPEVELWIIGYLDLGDEWGPWQHRIKHIPFVPWQELPAVLAQLDINLAPLEPGNPICECKSELKYFETAAVGVPTVASRIGAFTVAIRHGQTGLLADSSEDWYRALDELVTSPGRRAELGAGARADALDRYHPHTRSGDLLATLEEIGRTFHIQARDSHTPSLPTRPVHRQPEAPVIFKEHELAHALLDGLRGLEIGPASHNPFGLQTRNVACPEGVEVYLDDIRQGHVDSAHMIDIWACAESIPVPDRSEDFILSSHVIEHVPNVIAAFIEWNRIVRHDGFVFMIVPLKGALAADFLRDLTSLSHFVEDYRTGMTLDTHPIGDVPGGKFGHYHTFTPDSVLQIVDWMRTERLCDWELVAREDVDSKVGNGFTLVFRVKHAPSCSTQETHAEGLSEHRPA
jgi:glycosyltransferase involved in cell wall biosynthesis/SAM-dependent methyltransferase